MNQTLSTTPVAASTGQGLAWLIADSLVTARRNLAHVRQIPEKLFDVTLQPIMFTMLFAFVFGGVIAIPGGNYREYLIGGVLVQSLGFGIMGPATSIATDLREGVVDRFRSLPMARSAYVVGFVTAELATSLVAIAVLSLSGLIVGWGIYSDVPHALAGYGLLMLFAFAMLWLGTLLGLSVRSPDAAGGVVFLVMFPLTFLATTFVPIGGFAPGLRTIAAWNPISSMTAAVRTLFGNPIGQVGGAEWPLRHPIMAATGWCVLIILFALPLALRKFAHRSNE